MACVSDQSNQLPWEHLCSVRSLWVNHNCKCHCWKTYNISALVDVQDAELCHFHWWFLSWASSLAGTDIWFGSKREWKNNSSQSSLVYRIHWISPKGNASLCKDIRVEVTRLYNFLPNESLHWDPIAVHSHSGGKQECQRRNYFSQLFHTWEIWETDTLRRIILWSVTTYFTMGTITSWKKLFSIFCVVHLKRFSSC